MKNIFLLFLCFFSLSCSNKKVEQVDIKEKPLPTLVDGRYNVAFLIMDGTFNTELTAPFDIFQHTIFRDSIKAMNVFLVANTLESITTFEGIRLLPDYDYLTDSLPKIDKGLK